jgi:hypothetical protein
MQSVRAMPRDVIHLHPLAPPKPAVGAACNGCGVCCAWRPCPLGALTSLRLRGPCRRLRWDDAVQRYRCGLLAPVPPGRRPAWLQALLRRWIAAGQGCDARLDVSG